MDYLLEVEQVYAGYVQDLYILQGVNFRIAPRELVTVIGPNGAGKSTLAKTIFGLLKPSAGTITFKGKNITGWKSNQIVPLGMGYVPQIANVFPSLSIEENLEMGAFTSKGNIKSLKERIYAMFPRLDRAPSSESWHFIWRRKTDVSHGKSADVATRFINSR
jgi:neutral amino acid transport system ATP-binding protein